MLNYYTFTAWVAVCICIINGGKSHSVCHQLQTKQVRHTDVQPVEDVPVNH